MSTPLSKIFLADERGLNEAEGFRSYNSFHFGQYQREHKQPIGNLTVLNDELLAPSQSLTMKVEAGYNVLLIPVIGAVAYTDVNGTAHLAAAGQCIYIQTANELQYTIKNPFAEVVVNCIQLWIKTPMVAQYHSALYTYADVNEYLNQLVPVADEAKVYIGKFSGRGETVFNPTTTNSTLFAFVLAGAFEVEGCLLHDRDGLAMFEKTNAEIEALSNDAIILLIEAG
jgi:quercetin 2,3-dioxygenase